MNIQQLQTLASQYWLEIIITLAALLFIFLIKSREKWKTTAIRLKKEITDFDEGANHAEERCDQEISRHLEEEGKRRESCDENFQRIINAMCDPDFLSHGARLSTDTLPSLKELDERTAELAGKYSEIFNKAFDDRLHNSSVLANHHKRITALENAGEVFIKTPGLACENMLNPNPSVVTDDDMRKAVDTQWYQGPSMDKRLIANTRSYRPVCGMFTDEERGFMAAVERNPEPHPSLIYRYAGLMLRKADMEKEGWPTDPCEKRKDPAKSLAFFERNLIFSVRKLMSGENITAHEAVFILEIVKRFSKLCEPINYGAIPVDQTQTGTAKRSSINLEDY